jgi:hypothetical protein
MSPLICAVEMPRCDDRPDGVCPDKRNDKNVHRSQGDLMLCDACKRARLPSIGGRSRGAADVRKAASVLTASETQQTCYDLSDTGNICNNSRQRNTTVRSAKENGRVSLEEPTDAVTGHAGSCDLPALSAVTINELLAYVNHYRNKSNVDALRRTLCSFFLCGRHWLSQKGPYPEFKPNMGGLYVHCRTTQLIDKDGA